MYKLFSHNPLARTVHYLKNIYTCITTVYREHHNLTIRPCSTVPGWCKQLLGSGHTTSWHKAGSQCPAEHTACHFALSHSPSRTRPLALALSHSPSRTRPLALALLHDYRALACLRLQQWAVSPTGTCIVTVAVFCPARLVCPFRDTKRYLEARTQLRSTSVQFSRQPVSQPENHTKAY